MHPGTPSPPTRLVATVVVWALALAACGSSSGSPEVSDRSRSSLLVTDVAQEASVAQATQTHGENCVADFDGDGLSDLLLSTHREDGGWPLYQGLPDGRFRLNDAVDFARRDRHGCAVADFNGDGLLDIYMSIGGCEGTCEEPKELWIQQADHTFVDEAERWGIDDPGGRGRVPVVLNANDDDLPDLFTGQEEGVDYPSLNRVWINRGDHFELQGGQLTNELGNNCAAASDIDGDGLDEVVVCTPENGFFLYRNDGGVFVDATASFGLASYGRRTAELVDIDGDGRVDLVTVERSRVQILLNEGNRFGDASFIQELEDGKDVAFGDVDGDGDLDVYVQQGADTDEPDLLLLSEGDGRGFTPGPPLPPTTSGAGDTVVALPNWKGSGRVAFVVNNGFQDEPGPRRRQIFQFTDR